MLLPLATAAAAAAAGAGRAEEPSVGTTKVVDATNLLAPSTEKALEALVGQLQRDTGLKVRVVCPPSGIERSKESYGEYMRPISKAWELDQSSIVLSAEERAQGRTGRSYSLLNFSPGFRLLERFQFRLTSEYFIRTKNRFGNNDYVNAKGPDVAVMDGARNLVACLYKLTDDRGATCPDPLDEKEVAAILARHPASA